MKDSTPHSLLRPNMAVGIGAVVAIPAIACLIHRPPMTVAAFALFVFNNINVIIAACEIILGLRIDFIKEDYTKMKARTLDETSDYTEYTAMYEYLFAPAAPSWLALFTTTRPWARMWSVYALIDPSYQNHDSFGFFVDVGNGWSTLPVCILWNLALADLLPLSAHSQVYLAVLGLASYWQMSYGTLVYWLSYIFHRRYRILHPMCALSLVATVNGVWVAFPVIGIYIAVRVLLDLADGKADAWRSTILADYKS